MKTKIVFEFETPAEAQAFLTRVSGNSPQPAQAQAQAPVMQQAPAPQPVQQYAPAPQPVAAVPPPVAAPPAQVGAPLAPDGQPWTQQKVLPYMQAYAQQFKAAGIKAVFDRYGAPPMLPNCDAVQLANVGNHFMSMQPA